MCDRGPQLGAMILVIAALSAFGCSVPRHNNALIFGTNTSFGLDAAYNQATQTPQITVGYKRQEAIFLPLLANKNAQGDAAVADDAKDIDDKAAFRGTDGDKTDSYSVIASLGVSYSGKAKITADKNSEAGAEGAISQYIATGLAARLLAEKGGSSVVGVQSAEVAKASSTDSGTGATLDESIKAFVKAMAKGETEDIDAEKLEGFCKAYPKYGYLKRFTTQTAMLDAMRNSHAALSADLVADYGNYVK